MRVLEGCALQTSRLAGDRITPVIIIASILSNLNDIVLLKIDLSVVNLLNKLRPLIGTARAIRVQVAGCRRERDIGVKPEPNPLDRGDLWRFLAGALGGRAQIAA
jgi:hypothetical protein